MSLSKKAGPSLVPRPSPGFESSDENDDVDVGQAWMSLLAASMRAAVGVLCLGVALLYLPPNMGTPVLSGVAVLMIVNGCLATWRCGRMSARLRPMSRALVYFFPAVSIAIFVAVAVFGPALLGPDWRALKSAHQATEDAAVTSDPVTFQPAASSSSP